MKRKKWWRIEREREREKNDKCFGIDFSVRAPSVPLLNAIGRTIEKSKCGKKRFGVFFSIRFAPFCVSFHPKLINLMVSNEC